MADLLKNDMGVNEEQLCSGFLGIGLCSWGDVQSWARALQLRRDRAFNYLKIKPEDEWTPADQVLRAWANSSAVRGLAGWRNDQFGWPEVEDVQNIIGQIKEGEGLLDVADAPLVRLPSESGARELGAGDYLAGAVLLYGLWRWSDSGGEIG
jgi:hypothetical protein